MQPTGVRGALRVQTAGADGNADRRRSSGIVSVVRVLFGLYLVLVFLDVQVGLAFRTQHHDASTIGIPLIYLVSSRAKGQGARQGFSCDAKIELTETSA